LAFRTGEGTDCGERDVGGWGEGEIEEMHFGRSDPVLSGRRLFLYDSRSDRTRSAA
jgi:hypothetical protein